MEAVGLDLYSAIPELAGVLLWLSTGGGHGGNPQTRGHSGG
jgi:hypothetical protein